MKIAQTVAGVHTHTQVILKKTHKLRILALLTIQKKADYMQKIA